MKMTGTRGLFLFAALSACAHGNAGSEPPATAAAAESPATETHVPFSQLKGRAVALKLMDRRTALTQSRAVLDITHQLVAGVLRQGGVQLLPESKDAVVVMVDDLGEREQGSTTHQCAKVTGRFLKEGQDFLPTEVSSERCLLEGQPETYGAETTPLTRSLLAGASRLPGADKKPLLGRAYAVALADLLLRLDRQAR